MIQKKRLVCILSLLCTLLCVCKGRVHADEVQMLHEDVEMLSEGQKIYHFELSRASFPFQKQIDDERNSQWYANVKRNVALTASALVFCCTIYATIKSCEFFTGLSAAKRQQAEDHFILRLLMEQNKEKLAISNVAALEASTNISTVPVSSVEGFSWDSIIQGAKNFVTGCGSIIAQGAPTVLAGIVLNKVNNVFTDAVQRGSVERNVQWHVQYETKLGNIVKDLELYTVGYDINSPLLNLDNLKQDTNMHLKQFVQEFVNRAQARKQSDFFAEDYFKFLFDELKKKYVKNGGEIEKLQDLAVGKEAQQARHESDLFNRDKAHRQDIVDLCNLLVQEVQKISTFVLAHFDNNQPVMAGCAGHEQKIMDLISTTNAYLDIIETLLNTSDKELQKLSIEGKGMFTCTYEFIKVLKQQIEHIHQYCSITG